MALRVWLPLNGNLRNLGLDNFTLTNNNVIVDDSGKLGQCYSFNGTNSYLNFNNFSTLDSKKYLSICFWVYSDTGNLYGFFDCINSSGHQLSLISSGLYFRDSKHGSFTSIAFEQPSVNIWTHYCIIYNNGNWTIYKNNVKIKELTYTSALLNSGINNVKIGLYLSSSTTQYYSGKLNDFRIYDHCLSEDEIHELSLGKIGHWKLNDYEISRSGLTSVNWNLLIQNGNFSDGSTGWSTTSLFKNFVVSDNTLTGDICAINGAVIGLRKTGLSVIEGHKYIIKVSILWTTTYSGSGKLNMTPRIWGSDFYYYSSPTLYVNPNKWVHSILSWTSSITSSVEFRFYIRNYSDAYHTTNDKLSYRNIQLFDLTQMFGSGNEPTRKEFETMFPLHYYPYDAGTVKNLTLSIPDISGNHYDLTVSGNPTLSDDSVRYDKSTLFNGSSKLYCTSPTAEAKTVSLWWYVGSALPSSNEVMFADYKSCLAVGYRKTYNALLTRCRETLVNDVSVSNIKLNSWNHIVVVLDSSRQVYVNGLLASTIEQTSYWGHNTDTLMIGGRESSSVANCTGKISDVRLYATALSADDVLKLYKLGNV